MPEKYHGEPEPSKRDKKIEDAAKEIAKEKELLKRPFPKKGRKPAVLRRGGGLKGMDKRELDEEFPNRFTYKPWV